MEYKKTSILLKKIQSLRQTLKESGEHPSSIEQDLMKSYLRDFYDCFVAGDGDTDIFANAEPTVVAEKHVETVEEPDQAAITNNIPEPTLETNLVAPDVIKQEEQEEPEAITDKELIVEPEEILEQIVTDPVDQDLLALFSQNPVMDLSDKLSLLPVTDLTKALSINERYFTIQELFGGDADLFQQTLAKLNSLSNFKEASEELINSVASKYEWGTNAKKKKAENFIKLVRRRYQ